MYVSLHIISYQLASSRICSSSRTTTRLPPNNMTYSCKEAIIGGKHFCCCLRVRVGVIIMSGLGMLLGGILSIGLWYELASTENMVSQEKIGYAVAGTIETVLFFASILGFVGASAHSQSLVQIYAYIIYVHFVLNLAVASYLLYVVFHFSANESVELCQNAIQNSQATDDCKSLLNIIKGVYVAGASIVLLVELYGVLIVTRYMRQLKTEKFKARASRLNILVSGSTHYSGVPLDEQDRNPLYMHSKSMSGGSDQFDNFNVHSYGPEEAIRPAYAKGW